MGRRHTRSSLSSSSSLPEPVIPVLEEKDDNTSSEESIWQIQIIKKQLNGRNKRKKELSLMIHQYGFDVSPSTQNNCGLVVTDIHSPEVFSKISNQPLDYGWYEIQKINDVDVTKMAFTLAQKLLLNMADFPMNLTMTKKPASYCLVLDDLPRKRHTTLGWEFCVRKHIGKVQVVSCARLDPDNLPLYHFADQRNQTLVNRQYVISINDLAVDPLNLNEAVELISHCFKTSNSMTFQFEVLQSIVPPPEHPVLVPAVTPDPRKRKFDFNVWTGQRMTRSQRSAASSQIDLTSVPTIYPVRRGPTRNRNNVPVVPTGPPMVIELGSDSDSDDVPAQLVRQHNTRDTGLELLHTVSPPVLSRGTIVRTSFGVGQIFKTLSSRADNRINVAYVVRLSKEGYRNVTTVYVPLDQVTNVSHERMAVYRTTRNKSTIWFTRGDIGRLFEGEYLNDSIIDFYLSHVYENYDHAGNPAIHIFSCFFFEQYRKCAERREGKDVEDHLKIAHAQVSRWTKGTDLFSKDILLIPINDKTHWSLVVVLHLPLFKKGKERAWKSKHDEKNFKTDLCDDEATRTISSDDQTLNDEPTVVEPQDVENNEELEPCILMMDSMKCHRTQTMTRHIRNYLSSEWNATWAATLGPQKFLSGNLPNVSPVHIPRQKNSCDCGVFLLQYAQLLLQKLPLITRTFIEQKGNDPALSHTWFHPTKDISNKRQELRELIEALPST